jgi:hypothetical protein
MYFNIKFALRLYYVLKTYKRCTLKKPHEFCSHVLHVVYVSTCFLYYFNAFFMWKQHKPFQGIFRGARLLCERGAGILRAGSRNYD